MKEFKNPEIEVVYFNQDDVIATSLCPCDKCPDCEDGKNHCPCFDFAWSNT